MKPGEDDDSRRERLVIVLASGRATEVILDPGHMQDASQLYFALNITALPHLPGLAAL